MAQSQQTNVEDYLSERGAESRGEGYRIKRKGGKIQWMNHYKNGNLIAVKPLIDLADTATEYVVVVVLGGGYNTNHSKSRL